MQMVPPDLPSRGFADRIRRVGFRKWYERELLSSHGHLLLTILSVVAMLASFEAFHGASAVEKSIDLLFVVLSAAIALWSLRRYLFLSLRAEALATQAICGDCGTYGRFRVVSDNGNSEETRVCCNKCAHQWTISG